MSRGGRGWGHSRWAVAAGTPEGFKGKGELDLCGDDGGFSRNPRRVERDPCDGGAGSPVTKRSSWRRRRRKRRSQRRFIIHKERTGS